MAGVAIVPLLASAGAGPDMARLSLAKTALQTAAYFDHDIAAMGGLVPINSLPATPSVSTNAQGYPSFRS